MRYLLLFTAVVMLFGCSRTIIRAEDPDAGIYMDDRYLGTGTANIASIGPPNTANIELKIDDEVVGQAFMSRSFNWKTILFGLCSYYTGFYWAWYYPEEQHVSLYSKHRKFKNSGLSESVWTHPENSIWMQPVGRPNKTN
jgi:hypothetical protein